MAAQHDDDYTLQLFAVDHLDRIERLTANHPDVPLYLLTSDGRVPRFRLVHGSYSSEEQARVAHETLPAEFRSQAPEPFVRRIGNLREELRSSPGDDSPATARAAVDPPSIYTLQIFASSNRENVDRLLARYRALDLRVHISEGGSTQFRVLYGLFDSPQAAQDASAKLPPAMLEEVGKPLLRDTAEFN